VQVLIFFLLHVLGFKTMKTFNIYCDESCHLENDGQPIEFLANKKGGIALYTNPRLLPYLVDELT